MPSWYSDGNVGSTWYADSTPNLVEPMLYLASDGTVDTNFPLRIQYNKPMQGPLDPTSSQATFDYVRAAARINFTQGEQDALSTTIDQRLTVSMFVAPASDFAANTIPTPTQIAAAPNVSVFRSGNSTKIRGDIAFGIIGPRAATLGGNGKFWVLVCPTRVTWGTTPSVANDARYIAQGRAVSVWTNRTPAKPTIIQPSAVVVQAPGSLFDLTFDSSSDPDFNGGYSVASSWNINGAQIQRAAVPADPATPLVWTDVRFNQTSYNEGQVVQGTPVPDSPPDVNYRLGWAIQGSSVSDYNNNIGIANALLARGSVKVACALPEGAPVPKYGASEIDGLKVYVAVDLPEGDWYLRMRTFDPGGEGGYYPINYTNGNFTPDSYPAFNRSEWSTPVRVIVPTQVPPPLPLTPINSIAIPEGTPVTLTWQYRNSYIPPRPQTARSVQIRKVGDAVWSNLVSGNSASPSYLVPPPGAASAADAYRDAVLADTPMAYYRLAETSGTTMPNSSGTAGRDGTHGTAVVLNQAGVFTGNQAAAYNAGTGVTAASKTAYAAWMDTPNVTIECWLKTSAVAGTRIIMGRDNGSGAGYLLRLVENIPQLRIRTTSGSITTVAGPASIADGTWKHVVGTYDGANARLYINGVQVAVVAVAGTVYYTSNYPLLVGNPTTGTIDEAAFYPTALSAARIQAHYTAATVVPVTGFALTATNQYEWRVQVTDSGGIVSAYSDVAQFWIVPAAGSGGVIPFPANTLNGATLGCGTYRVEVYRRGGLVHAGELSQVSYLDWGRVRDDISTAKIVVSGWDLDCGNLLSKLQTWAYEVVIWRETGFSTDRVWEGPITLLTYEVDKVTIEAKDVVAYPYRRIIKQAMSDSGKSETAGRTVVARATQILQNTLAPDDPNVLAYLRVMAGEKDAKQYRSLPAYSRTAFEEIDDMAANAGLDYTAVGRSIVLWGTKHRIGTLPEFRDKDLGEAPIVSEYGMSFADRYVVSDGNGVHGEANRLPVAAPGVSGNDPVYGLVEMLSSTWASESETDTGTYTQEGIATVRESFAKYAERSIADRYPPPVVVRVPDNTTVNASAVVSIQHLVPGVVIPLRSTRTLRKVAADQKLDSVKVTYSEGKEVITVTMSPFNGDDSQLEA